MSEPTEGWYADPSGAGQLRWWDGHAWTEYVEPYQAQAPHEAVTDEAASPGAEEPAEAYAPASSASTPTFDATAAAAGLEPATPSTPSPAAPADVTGSNEDLADEADRNVPAGQARPSGMLKWILGCAASWLLVVAFIAVLALAWSHLGPSGRIHEDAKARAEKAQQELDTARSSLEDINRQIEEANK